MKRRREDGIWLAISIFSFIFLSVGFLLMPIESEIKIRGISIFSFSAGIVFWSALLMGAVSQLVLGHRMRKWCAENKLRGKKTIGSIGLTSFFKNKFAVVADILTLISLIGFVIAMFLTQSSGYVCYVFLALFIFSFSMHCIFNGKKYYYVINQTKMVESIKKERAKLSNTERTEKDG